MSVTTEEGQTLSTECTVARRPGYESLHEECRQLADVKLPHAKDILLIARCRCECHGGRR